MSLTTVLWSMNAGVCLTLAVMHLFVWLHARKEYGHLLFTISALTASLLAESELALMHAQTIPEFCGLLRWGFVFGNILIVSIICFALTYLHAGRWWLALAAVSMRGLALIISFKFPCTLFYLNITDLKKVSFLGEQVTVAEGIRNPWVIIGQLSSLLLFAFLIDVTRTVWLRGERRRAIILGGGMIFFTLTAAIHTALVQSGVIQSPYLISIAFVGILIAMAYELSRDVLRSSHLVRDLQTSEAQTNLAAQSANLGLWVRDLATGKVFATERFRELLGFSVNEPLTFETVLSHIHSDDRQAMRQIVEGAITKRTHYDTQYRVVSPDGSERWISSTGRAQYDTKGKPTRTLGVSIDITQRRRSEQEVHELRRELAHVDRVTMLGQLASALAHELNQPLGAILRNAEAAELFLKMDKPDIEEVQAILIDIRKDDQRAGQVIERMRALMKKRTIDMQTMGIAPLVEEVVMLIRSDAVARGVMVRTQVLDDLPYVHGDRVQLQQVLLNLILNGMDAVAGQGEGERCITVRMLRGGPDMVEIAVSDTGHGIPDDKRAKLFEPFFTTKTQGMGVGLAICRMIVETHGGRIWAENNRGQGAIFRVTLPIANSKAQV